MRTAQLASTALGRAIQERRGTADQGSTAAVIGVPRTTLSRIERGTHLPRWDTAVALAAWLGWTPGQVMDAAATPVDPAP